MGIPSSSNSHDARRPSARCALTLFAAVVFLFTSTVHAGRYELVKGKGVEVCEAYKKNLDSFKDPDPMICERKINPEFENFAKPAWRMLTLEQAATINIETAEQVLASMSKDHRTPKEPKSVRVRKAIKQITANHNDSYPYAMQQASVDIANSGWLVSIARETHGRCDGKGIPMVVLRAIGKDATDPTLKNALESAMFRTEEAKIETSHGKYLPVTKREPLGSVMFPDIFRYKNESYFDIWAAERDSPDLRIGRLYVFQHKGGKTNALCEFDFHRDK